jgi:rSAM/selenodomain-associated transferase 1
VSAAVVVFAKEPRPGLVKTRMTPPFAPAEAAALYACMLDDVLEATARFAERLGFEPIVSVHPPAACAALARRAPRAFRAVAQRGADLGERMEWALAETAAGGSAPVLIRGSDSPALDADTLRAALAALAEADLVVCPDLDGGYNLLGLREPAAGLLSHPMSTPSVLADTLASASGRGLRARVLEPGFDLDTASDFAHLARARNAPSAALCRRTLAWLDASRGWQRLGLAPASRQTDSS